MSHHVRQAQYAWGYDWPDDCPPPYRGRVAFMHVRPNHVPAALHLPPCQPRAGVNADWSAAKCAILHKTSSYALLPSPPAQPPASPSAALTQTPVLQPPQPQASPSAAPTQILVLQPPQPQPHALQPAPPAQPTPPKPAADPVTVGQAAHDHAHPEPTMANLGFDVAVGLSLAMAFAVVRRFILPPRLSPGQADVVEHETRRQLREQSGRDGGSSDGLFV
jgi:hypothetical protein